MIRANQGHSIAIESDKLLTKIDESNVPQTCVHGTSRTAWNLIVASGGLKRMNRQHIHFASGLPAGFRSIPEQTHGIGAVNQDLPVISGMRNSSTVLVYVDVARAMASGIKFWLSENGVILTEGNQDGILPLEYFSLVEDRKHGPGVLVKNGQIIQN